MHLDVIPVAAAVLLLDHVPGLDQVRDDTEGAPLGDVQALRDIAQTHSGVVGDQQQNPSMGGQEGPARHVSMLTVSGKSLLVLRLRRNYGLSSAFTSLSRRRGAAPEGPGSVTGAGWGRLRRPTAAPAAAGGRTGLPRSARYR